MLSHRKVTSPAGFLKHPLLFIMKGNFFDVTKNFQNWGKKFCSLLYFALAHLSIGWCKYKYNTPHFWVTFSRNITVYSCLNWWDFLLKWIPVLSLRMFFKNGAKSDTKFWSFEVLFPKCVRVSWTLRSRALNSCCGYICSMGRETSNIVHWAILISNLEMTFANATYWCVISETLISVVL